MKYAISNGGKTARLTEKVGAGELEWAGPLPGGADEYDTGLVIDGGAVRVKRSGEIDAEKLQIEAKRQESDTARDDAKRALSALDTIIAGAPTATNAQMRTAIEQLARIQKHAILATLGR